MTSALSATGRGARGERSKRLQLLRVGNGWKQSQLLLRLEAAAAHTGVDIAPRPSLKTMVSKWENGAAMSADYRRLFRDVYGMTDEQLGFESSSTPPAPLPALVRSDVGQLVECSAQLRHSMDALIEREPTTGAHLDSLEQRVDLHARDCVREAPLAMLSRLLSDFREVEALASHRHQPRTLLRLYGVAANYASLIADEMMVLGRASDSQAWHSTAKTAADQTDDPALRARTRSLNALLYLYFGDPIRTITLAQQAQALAAKPAAATAMAAAVEAFAYSRKADVDACRRALCVAADHFERQPPGDLADSVFGFAERRWLFYRSRALLRIGTADEALSATDEAIRCYPLDVVGDTTVVQLDLARRLASDGELLDATILARTILTEMRPEYRTRLFTTAGREVLASVSALGRNHRAVQDLHAVVEHEHALTH